MEEGMAHYSTRRFHYHSTPCALPFAIITTILTVESIHFRIPFQKTRQKIEIPISAPFLLPWQRRCLVKSWNFRVPLKETWWNSWTAIKDESSHFLLDWWSPSISNHFLLDWRSPPISDQKKKISDHSLLYSQKFRVPSRPPAPFADMIRLYFDDKKIKKKCVEKIVIRWYHVSSFLPSPFARLM